MFIVMIILSFIYVIIYQYHKYCVFPLGFEKMTYFVLKRRTAFCRFCRFFVTWAVVSSNTYSPCVLCVIFCERTTEANSGGVRINLLFPPFIFGVCERGFLPVIAKGKSLIYSSKLNDTSLLSFNMARNMPCKHQIQGVRMFQNQIRKQCDFAK